VEEDPPRAARRVPPGRRNRLVASGGRQLEHPGGKRGAHTGPNPTDRARAGSKHHVLTEAQGIPLVVTLTGANAHDVTQLLPLVDAIAPLQGDRGRPCFRPARVQGDRAYHSKTHEAELRARNIQPVLAHRGTGHGSGLGTTRWVVERTISWLHQYRRLRVRYERRVDSHEAFLTLGCVLICCKIAPRVF
jgi:IS5 family transposase